MSQTIITKESGRDGVKRIVPNPDELTTNTRKIYVSEDGSALSPYGLETAPVDGIDTAEGMIPATLKHTVDLLLESGEYGADDVEIAFSRRVAGGQLRVVGVGDCEVKDEEFLSISSVETLDTGLTRIRWKEQA